MQITLQEGVLSVGSGKVAGKNSFLVANVPPVVGTDCDCLLVGFGAWSSQVTYRYCPPAEVCGGLRCLGGYALPATTREGSEPEVIGTVEEDDGDNNRPNVNNSTHQHDHDDNHDGHRHNESNPSHHRDHHGHNETNSAHQHDRDDNDDGNRRNQTNSTDHGRDDDRDSNSNT
jgi:hypothetical protein